MHFTTTITKNRFTINLLIDFSSKTFSIKNNTRDNSFIFIDTKNDTRDLCYLMAEAQTLAFEKLKEYEKEIKTKEIDLSKIYEVKSSKIIEINNQRKPSKWIKELFMININPNEKTIKFETPNKLDSTFNKKEKQLDYILKMLKCKEIKFQTILENTSTNYTASVKCGFSEIEFEIILDKIKNFF